MTAAGRFSFPLFFLFRKSMLVFRAARQALGLKHGGRVLVAQHRGRVLVAQPCVLHKFPCMLQELWSVVSPRKVHDFCSTPNILTRERGQRSFFAPALSTQSSYPHLHFFYWQDARRVHQRSFLSQVLPDFTSRSKSSHTERRVVRFTPEQVFQVVSCVEEYIHFIPWCRSARIIQSHRAAGVCVLT